MTLRRILLCLVLGVFLAACGLGGSDGDGDGGGSGGGGGGGGGGGTTPPPPSGPPTRIVSSLGGCGDVADRYGFTIGRGQSVSLRLDTTSASTAADLCLIGRCGAVDVGADDEMPCSFAPPSYACGITEADARRTGACTVDVTVCSPSCTDPIQAAYALTVAVEGGGPQVTPLENDIPRAQLSGLCTDGDNDSEPCNADGDCPSGSCNRLPVTPPPGRGGALSPPVTTPSGEPQDCTVRFVMRNAVSYGNIKFKTDYRGVPGMFDGDAAEVGCDRRVGGSGQFVDLDASRVLTTRLLSGNGIEGPTLIATCAFESRTPDLDGSDFQLVVTEARGLDDSPIDPGMEVVAGCGDTTTTTSMPDSVTTTTIPGGPTTTLSGPTTTIPGGTTLPPGTTTTLFPGTTTTLSQATTTTRPAGTTTTLPDVDCGTLLSKWGGLGNGAGLFNTPSAVATDTAGQAVYVADTNNDRVQKFDLTGGFLRSWGGPGNDDGELSSPTDVTVAPDGTVYVADTNNSRIQRFDSLGRFLTKWGSRGSGDGQFSQPVGVAVDATGAVYVSDRGNTRIQKFDPTGNFLTKWGSSGSATGQLLSPEGIAIGENTNVFVADSRRDRVIKFNSVGDLITEFGSRGTGPGEFTRPFDVFVEGGGDIFVADTGRNRIQKLDSSGNFVGLWGQFGRGDGQFDSPRSVGGIGEGVVYVADSANHRIQRFRCR